MRVSTQITRRDFLKTSSAVGAGFVVGFNAIGAWATSTEGAVDGIPINPFVHIGGDGSVTVIAKHFEMGQGTTTGLTTLVAEELDVPWESVLVDFAPSDNDRYKNLFFGSQGTGGSTAIANSFMQYRQAGAAARAVLVQAAADEWGVPAASVSVDNGELKAGNRSAGFGEFASAAAKLSPPAEPVLKSPENFTLIGADKIPRKDSAAKTNGTATFAMDVKVPNMLYVVVLRSPKAGGVLKSFDAAKAKDMKGYVDAKPLPNHSGVAVYAQSTWAAIKARRSITAEWDLSGAESRSSEHMAAEIAEKLNSAPQFDAKGNFADVLAMTSESEKSVEATINFPWLAHAPMEPLNCVIEPTETGVRVHDGCQFQSITHPTVAGVLQLDPENVEIKTYYAGGSFGRRANFTSDYHAEAAMAYGAMGGTHAVKLIWTREDDLAGGYYRPIVSHKAQISVGDNGKISGWAHQSVAKSIAKGTFFEDMMVKDGIDHTTVEGILDTPYGIENMAVGVTDFETPVTALWWRSVGHSHSGYTMEVLMDMAAELAGKDPIDFRLAHLNTDDPVQARVAGVLSLAAKKSGWDGTKDPGKGRGVAVHHSFNSFVAQVTDVSVDDAGKISIDKILCAVDCGIAVNPDVVRAQMEGGIGYGLGAVMRNEISFVEGAVEQQNFPQYKPLRITDMPDIEVHIVPSTEAPTGVGEPGLPPAGPALANAIYAATGKRVTNLPMESDGIVFA